MYSPIHLTGVKMLKFCKDCKHYKAFKPGILGDAIRVDHCLKNPSNNLVTGYFEYRFANVERTIVNEPNHCNQSGDWFEAIEDAEDLDDLSKIPFGR